MSDPSDIWSTLHQALRRVPFLSPLDEGAIDELAGRGQRLVLDAGQPVFCEGDPADGLYVLLEGCARVFRTDPESGDVELTRLGPGDFFGELALLDGGARSASVQILSAGTVFRLSRESFLNLIGGRPEVLERVLTALTARVRDTSERFFRDELAARTLQMRMELERHRSMAQLVAGVAHELNTPLGVMRTALGVLEDQLAACATANLAQLSDGSELLATLSDAAALIRKNLTRAARLVGDFKKVSVLDLSEPLESMNLADVVDEALEKFSLMAPGHRLVVTIAQELPDGVGTWTGPRGALTDVLVGLLANCAQHAYAEGEGGPVRLSLYGCVRGDRPGWVFEVADRGAGIPAALIKRVFDPFVTTARARGSTGLGLAIVHNLATAALGGDVTCASEVGVGTTVRLWLPASGAPGRAALADF